MEVDTDRVLEMQQDQSHEQSHAQMLHAPPPAKAMPVQQSQLVTDVFDKHFKDIDTMSAEQVMDKLRELHATLDIDVFYKVASIFEKEPEDFPPHPQALAEDTRHVTNVVQVENKRSEAVTGTGSTSSDERPRLEARPPVPDASVTSSVTEVPKYKGPSAAVSNTAPVTSPSPKKAPPQLPKSEAKPPLGPPPPVVAKAVRLEIPQENQQQPLELTPVTGTGSVQENAEDGEDVMMTGPQISVRGPPTRCTTPAVPIEENVQTSQATLAPSSIANLHVIPPNVDQHVKAPRAWPVTEVTGPEFPGTAVTTVLHEAEWNMTQFADLPLQTARVQGTIMQQLMNLANNQDSRMRALESLVTNQFNILTSTPGSQLLEGTIPALINASLETKATLERLSKEVYDKQVLKNQQPYSAVEAFQHLTSQNEALQKRQQEMVKAITSMGERIKELQQSHQLLQKENTDLRRTTKFLQEAITSHETSLLHVQSELQKVTDRSEGQAKQIQTLMSKAEHDRTSHKKEIEQIHTALGNIYAVLARHEANTENIVTREVARDERSIGLMTDLNNHVTLVENTAYGLSPLVRLLCEHSIPELVRELRPLAPVTNKYWGMIVPINGQPSVRQVASSLVSPQFPEGGVAVAFAVPAATEVTAQGDDEPGAGEAPV
eukprot:5451734-Amphidinium_carterae.1